MGLQQSRIAAKFINVMDQVQDARPVPVPAFTEIRRVDTDTTLDFVREKTRDTGEFWAEFNDLRVGDLTWLGKGECE